LKGVWDREYSILNEKAEDRLITNTYSLNIGDAIGIPLIEAYLNDNKPREANEIFDAWPECDGKFTNFAKVLKLAKNLKIDGLAA
jgi:hypothetical protein